VDTEEADKIRSWGWGERDVEAGNINRLGRRGLEDVIREDELKRSGRGPDFGVAVVFPVRDANADLLFANIGDDNPITGRDGLSGAFCSCGERYLLSRKLGLGGGEYSLS